MYLALYVERLGYEFGTILVTLVCISYFALQISINPTRDTFLVSKKSWQSWYIYVQSFHLILNSQNNTQVFFEKSMFSEDGLKCHLKRKQFFEENMDLSKKLVCCFASLVLYIFLKEPCMNVRYFVVNCVLFWLLGYARETLVERSKTWVDYNIKFSTSILCTKK